MLAKDKDHAVRSGKIVQALMVTTSFALAQAIEMAGSEWEEEVGKGSILKLMQQVPGDGRPLIMGSHVKEPHPVCARSAQLSRKYQYNS